MTPVLLTGAPPGSRGEKKEIEKPRPSPAGPRKSLYAVFRARETFGSPAQGGLENKGGAHHSGRAIETAHDDSP